MRLAIFLLFLMPALGLADRIVLKNGKEYKGTYVSTDTGRVKFRISAKVVRTFLSADIAKMEIGGAPAPDPAPRRATPQAMQADRATTPPAATPRPETPPAQPPPTLTVPDVGMATTSPLDKMGAVDSEYTRMGSEAGPLGAPRAPQQPTADGRASVRFYTRGAIYWTSAAGAHALTGPVFQAWLSTGGERSKLGYPTGDEDVRDAGATRTQTFENGTIVWTQSNGAEIR